MAQEFSNIIAIIPAAGHGARLGSLPFSKELYPVGFCRSPNGAPLRPKAACEYLLEALRLAGIARGFVVIRPEKSDIPAYLGDGRVFGLHLAYIAVAASPSSAHSVDAVFPFVGDAVVALGFPDILFRPSSMFRTLACHQANSKADVVLGVVPTTRPEKADVLVLDAAGRVSDLIIKPSSTDLRQTWAGAVWAPTFTRFLHDWLSGRGAGDPGAAHGEIFLGDAIRAAIACGLCVEGVDFAEGAAMDIGTPDDLEQVLGGAYEFES